MEGGLIELATQYGVLGGLLLAVLYWLAKHYLPGQQRQHREELEHILACHDRNINRLVSVVDRNSRVVQLNSQALLTYSLTRDGISAEEAERIVRRIQLSTLNGCTKPSCTQGKGAATDGQ